MLVGSMLAVVRQHATSAGTRPRNETCHRGLGKNVQREEMVGRFSPTKYLCPSVIALSVFPSLSRAYNTRTMADSSALLLRKQFKGARAPRSRGGTFLIGLFFGVSPLSCVCVGAQISRRTRCPDSRAAWWMTTSTSGRCASLVRRTRPSTFWRERVGWGWTSDGWSLPPGCARQSGRWCAAQCADECVWVGGRV